MSLTTFAIRSAKRSASGPAGRGGSLHAMMSEQSTDASLVATTPGDVFNRKRNASLVASWAVNCTSDDAYGSYWCIRLHSMSWRMRSRSRSVWPVPTTSASIAFANASTACSRIGSGECSCRHRRAKCA